ncbi:HlyD family efflux transporter periplasmic adaptor subunit [Phycisphaeraceae bacterium D3-23]
MPKPIKWTLIVVIALAVLAGVAFVLRPQPVPVEVAVVTVAPMRVSVDEEGKTRIRERYTVSSPLAGRLQRIRLDAGDAVEANQTRLVVIDPTDPALLDPRAMAETEARVRAAEAVVGRAEAELERARVALAFATDEHTRVQAMFESGAANAHDLEQEATRERTAAQEHRAAEFGKEIAQYELEVARSALQYAQSGEGFEGLTQMSIYSPIDGAVLRVFQQSMAVVAAGEPLIEVGDPRDLELVIDVLSTDAVNIHPGQHVLIEHWGGDHTLEAVVRIVEPSAFTKVSSLGIEEQRVNVIADFVTPADQRNTLGDGFRIEAGIVIWTTDQALQIHTSATFRDGGEWAVFVIQNGRATLRQIEIGRRNGETTQVISGLAEGDRVVRHPSDSITEGVRVVERDR